MKTPALLTAVIVSLLWVTNVPPILAKNDAGEVGPNLRIDYIQPERFTDFSLQGRSATDTVRIFNSNVGGPLAQALARRMPGARLTITFTDIDLAGRYEPWRGPRFSDIRFYRDSTPLRLDFRYALSDPRGKVLASGTDRVYEAY